MKPIHLDHGHPNCAATRDVLTIVGSKWAVLIVALLEERPKRFSELKREVGDISQKSLTAVLRELERDGILNRTVTPSIPPRVDYALTDLGQSLLKPIASLGRWAAENHPDVLRARACYLSGNKQA
ncbi:winged helix-turn-helix transcriptional regulator [Devosia submarina]|uniref:winged helix-turn-helix transcriptional regulator n=1 Tax=Devosia submarina TaxID=1173082 RepID=UPI000D36AB63|nr:helix-turn-helix domain-containing protein [Devosia submarina]